MGPNITSPGPNGAATRHPTGRASPVTSRVSSRPRTGTRPHAGHGPTFNIILYRKRKPYPCTVVRARAVRAAPRPELMSVCGRNGSESVILHKHISSLDGKTHLSGAQALAHTSHHRPWRMGIWQSNGQIPMHVALHAGQRTHAHTVTVTHCF